MSNFNVTFHLILSKLESKINKTNLNQIQKSKSNIKRLCFSEKSINSLTRHSLFRFLDYSATTSGTDGVIISSVWSTSEVSIISGTSTSSDLLVKLSLITESLFITSLSKIALDG